MMKWCCNVATVKAVIARNDAIWNVTRRLGWVCMCVRMEIATNMLGWFGGVVGSQKKKKKKKKKNKKKKN
jgi:hypothetical protein